MRRRIAANIAWVLGLVGLVGSPAVAQSVRVQITVHVRDSVGAVQGADVSVVLGVNDARASGVTDDRGRLTLQFGAADVNADYQLVVRKIGYARGNQFFHASRDSLSLEILLHRVVQELAPVVVSADQDLKRKSYHVGADDIANSTAVLMDATDILAKMRPDMICGRSCNPFASYSAMTRNPVRKCPGLALSQPQRCPVSNDPPSFATNVWVNGQRIRTAIPDEMAVARQHGALAGLSAASMTVLSEIKPEHIDEITYLDEWDTSIDKAGAQGALFVVLKPGIGYEAGKGSYVLETAAAATKSAAAPAPTQLPRYRFRLLGVYDGETGNPIEGAYVIELTTGTRARTSATGTVSLAFLPEGGTPLRIVKEGYDDLSIAVEISSEHPGPLTLVMVKHPVKPSPR